MVPRLMLQHTFFKSALADIDSMQNKFKRGTSEKMYSKQEFELVSLRFRFIFRSTLQKR